MLVHQRVNLGDDGCCMILTVEYQPIRVDVFHMHLQGDFTRRAKKNIINRFKYGGRLGLKPQIWRLYYQTWGC